MKVFRESEAGTKRADVTAICARAPGYGEALRNVTNLLRIVEDTFADAVFVLRSDVTLLTKLRYLCNSILAFQALVMSLE